MGSFCEGKAYLWSTDQGQGSRFHGLQSRISNKIYSEPQMHALSPCKGSVESFFNFIQNPLGVLCKGFHYAFWKTWIHYMMLLFYSMWVNIKPNKEHWQKHPSLAYLTKLKILNDWKYKIHVWKNNKDSFLWKQ